MLWYIICRPMPPLSLVCWETVLTTLLELSSIGATLTCYLLVQSVCTTSHACHNTHACEHIRVGLMIPSSTVAAKTGCTATHQLHIKKCFHFWLLPRLLSSHVQPRTVSSCICMHAPG